MKPPLGPAYGESDGADKMLLDLSFVVIGILLVVLLVFMTQVAKVNSLSTTTSFEETSSSEPETDTLIVFAQGDVLFDDSGRPLEHADLATLVTPKTVRVAVLFLDDVQVTRATEVTHALQRIAGIPVVAAMAPQKWIDYLRAKSISRAAPQAGSSIPE